MTQAEHPEALHAYIELDFPDMTAHKARKIVSNPALAAAVAERDDNATISRHFVCRGGAQLDGERYHLVPLDLRDAGAADPKGPTRAESSTERTATTLSKVRALLDPTRPTLVLAECVLCYMRPEESAAVLRWFGDEFERVVGAVYEMCGLEWVFGLGTGVSGRMGSRTRDGCTAMRLAESCGAISRCGSLALSIQCRTGLIWSSISLSTVPKHPPSRRDICLARSAGRALSRCWILRCVSAIPQGDPTARHPAGRA